MSDTQGTRFDRGNVVKSGKMTSEGFLRADAIVTRTGVFQYMNHDGSTRYELRHPDDVFKADSLKTMEMLPITNGHPAQKLVNAENAKILTVGHTGQKIKADGKFLVTSLKVTDASAIDEILSGRRQELSLGYTADVIEDEGVWEGQKYTHRQTNIKYNHLALVDRARAGSSARINMDQNDAQETESESNNYRQQFKERTMSEGNLANVTLDGIDYKAAPEVSNALKKATVRADQAQAQVVALAAERDKALAEKDAMKEKLDAAEKMDVEKLVHDGVQARVALIEDIKKIMGDKVDEIKIDGVSDKELKSLVVKIKCPKVDVTKQSQDYISARFDTLLEDAADEPMAEQRKQAAPKQDAKNDAKDDSAEIARKKMMEDMLAGK